MYNKHFVYSNIDGSFYNRNKKTKTLISQVGKLICYRSSVEKATDKEITLNIK